MSTRATAIPEFLDLTFQYLARPELHSCCLVNRQFNVCARSFLYRDISFHLHPERYNHQHTSQDQLFTHLQSKYVINHVQHISVYFNKINFGYKFGSNSPPIVDPDFGKKVADILSRATKLKTVHIENMRRSMYDHNSHQRGDDAAWECLEIASRDTVTKVLESVLTSPNSPTVSLKLYNYHNKEIRFYDVDQIADIEGNLAALRLNQQQRVSCLAITAVGILTKFDFALQFQQLRELEILNDSDPTYHSPIIGKTMDLAKVFEHMPLIKLTLPYSGVNFTTLPRQLQYLYLQNFVNIDQWRAICDLEKLKTLKMLGCLYLGDDQLSRFRSIGLKILELYKSEHRGNSLAIRSILSVCRLESLDVTPSDTRLYSLLRRVNVASSLKRLQVHKLPGHYDIHPLIETLKNTPCLENLLIPWPTMTSTTKPRDRQRLREEIPKCLSLFDFQTIATHCQHLKTIEFEIYPTIYDIFIEFRNMSTRDEAWFDLSFDEQQNHTFALQQLHKKIFIDDDSPCLDICTIVYHYRKGRFYQTEFNKLVLSMSQVRKHSNQSYNLL
jgi:hypothetical protein